MGTKSELKEAVSASKSESNVTANLMQLQKSPPMMGKTGGNSSPFGVHKVGGYKGKKGQVQGEIHYIGELS